MHTQEQRTKAVMLFIETGFDHAAAKSALGYPSPFIFRFCNCKLHFGNLICSYEPHREGIITVA